jgi:hypothetical protein
MSKKLSYNDFITSITEKNCKCNWSEEEFKEKYKTTKSKINIISSCEHESYVQYSNFIYQNSGVTCKKCSYEKMAKEAIKKNIGVGNLLQEYTVIKELQKLCEDVLEIKIMVEGTLADICFRPKDETLDLWIPIQIKTTKTGSNNTYTGRHFSLQNTYTNMYIILYSISDEKIWLLDHTDVTVKNITIGKHKSLYDKFMLELEDLSRKLLDLYKDNQEYKKTFELINIPIGESAKKEQEFNSFRESIFPTLEFTYPEMNGSIYDLLINKIIKVQDKVATMYYINKTHNPNEKRKHPAYIVNIYRGLKDNQYNLGDNHFYWIHLPDKLGCYIFPESVLHDQKFIGHGVGKQMSLYPYKTSDKPNKYTWTNKYLYFYDKDIKKILDIFALHSITEELNHIKI